MNIRSRIRRLVFSHIYTIAVFVVMLVAAISTGIVDLNDPDTSSVVGHLFLFLVPGATLIGLAGSFIVYRKGTKRAKDTFSINEKWSIFEATTTSRLRIYETIALISLLGLIITGYWINLVVTGLMILILFVTIPGRGKVMKILDLKNSDLEG